MTPKVTNPDIVLVFAFIAPPVANVLGRYSITGTVQYGKMSSLANSMAITIY